MQTGIFSLGGKNQLLILIIVAFGLNVNTLFNKYVLDDSVVLTENKFVEKGVKGIPEIIRQSYFKGFKELENLKLQGGRYRPLSLVVFAIEYQFFGANPFISHLINVLLFSLLIAFLFKLLNNHLFKNQHKHLAFFTCLLFVVHPIHTEVIANVKSRDEIITFILMVVSLIAFFKYSEKRSVSMLIVSWLSFFLALLAKETAAALVGIVPLVAYFFLNHSLKKSVLTSIPLFLILLGYIFIRFLIVGISATSENDVANTPYIFATTSETFATKTYIIIKYLQLLLLPHPLSFEYGYNQIPYIQILSLSFLCSALVIFGITGYAVYMLKKKTLISFSILYFLMTISLTSNFIVDTGTPLAERFLFEPSLAFCIVLSVCFLKAVSNFKLLATSFLFVIVILFSIKTISRNAVWKDYDTLVLTDLAACPNSLRINQFARDIFLTRSINAKNDELRKTYLKMGIFYGERMINICSKIPSMYIKLGYAYYNLNDYNKAAEIWKRECALESVDSIAKKFSKIYSDELYKLANGFYEQNKFDDAINCYRKSIELDSNHVESWYNAGGIYFLKEDTINANKAWSMVRKISPTHPLNKKEFAR